MTNKIHNLAEQPIKWLLQLTLHARAAIIMFGLLTPPLFAQTTNNPFSDPIEANEDIITVGYKEFALLPDFDGEAALAMDLEVEPEGKRYFVNDLHGILYTLKEGGEVTEFLNLNDPKWKVNVRWTARERGFTGLALHPEFNRVGTPGYGRFYTLLDSANTKPAPGFMPEGGNDAHDTLLLEWKARDANSEIYDGDAPRELIRMEQPFGNHNGGQIAFNPLAKSGTPEFGTLYISIGDGGSGGDPMNMSQNLSSIFGKILRINPLGSNSKNKQYGIPGDNPFVNASDASILREIYVYGTRSPNRIAWDSKNGQMYVADIGQNTVEEISPVNAGANLGWKIWEGSFRYVSRDGVDIGDPRNDPEMIFPVVEYDAKDPLMLPNSVASSGLAVYRGTDIPQLQNLLIFAELASGEIFYVSADQLPDGGQDAIRRILLVDDGENKTVLNIILKKNEQLGREEVYRADVRLAHTKDGKLFLLNKHDGVIRLLTK
ncbi:MAG: PQQ-dependent sugar dehydrogenase [Emcibacteraceae bacterium]|nr:PQQ-dependent sugar dehydrogenase [Emcibacteraceae bacterium]MDG1995923.1 PQQ-dependent sugar dehydrogenase [Emcibacteraceae bacterium]